MAETDPIEEGTPGPESPTPTPPESDVEQESAGSADAPADVPDAPDGSDASDRSDRSDVDQPLDLSRSTLVQPGDAGDEEPEEAEPETPETPGETDALRRTVEALLFAAEAPLTVREMARAAGSRSNVIRKVLTNLKEALDVEGRPWELLEVAGGWRLATRPEYFPAIQKLKIQRSQRRLTPAAMEVLALIAYSQEPIGRAEIEAVRGVDSGPVLRLLLERKLVRIAGRGEGLGQPLLYAVSQEFLEHFGLKSTKDLPQTGEFKG